MNPWKLTAVHVAMVIITASSWTWFYVRYKNLKRAKFELLENKAKNNCVVFYCRGKMSGWPSRNKSKITSRHIITMNVLYEPITHFIDAAQKTLDISTMVFSVEKYACALIEAQKRGVKVRLLLNFEHRVPLNKKLTKAGVKVVFFVVKNKFMNCIMHHKYMIRDASTEHDAVAAFGSMNLSKATNENFENFVFSDNKYVVQAFRDNFDGCLELIEGYNQDLYNTTLLNSCP